MMNKQLLMIIVAILFFTASIAKAVNEDCKQSDIYKACFSINKNSDSALTTEDERINNDPEHRGGYNFWIKSKIDKVQYCDVTFATTYSFYDTKDNIDGCSVTQPDDFPIIHETVQERIYISPKEKTEYMNRATDSFESAKGNKGPDKRPLYCSGSLGVSCYEGCPPGEVFESGSCQKGCDYKGEFLKIGEHYDYERVDSDSSSNTCSNKTIRVSCIANSNYKEDVIALRSGVMSGGECVDGCVSPAGILTIGNSRTGALETEYPSGEGFAKECHQYKTKYSCKANQSISTSRALVFSGWVDRENNCSKDKGCMSGSRKYDHGETWSGSSEYCAGYLYKSRTQTCDNGSVKTRTYTHRSCSDGVPGIEK